MSIADHVRSANILAGAGDYFGALTMAILAVAASSRKMFPKPFNSIDKPKREMGDGEAFERFLGGRIQSLFLDPHHNKITERSGFQIEFQGEYQTLEHILYKFYRNGVVHEAELAKEVEFRRASDIDQVSVTLTNDEVAVVIGRAGEKLVLDTGVIGFLTKAVVSAPINGAEFGIEHFDLVPTVADEVSFVNAISSAHNLTPGRIDKLKRILRIIRPQRIAEIDDPTLKSEFYERIASDPSSGGVRPALVTRGIAEQTGHLTDKGAQVLRELAAGYEYRQIG
jgi:hypothetical protein